MDGVTVLGDQSAWWVRLDSRASDTTLALVASALPRRLVRALHLRAGPMSFAPPIDLIP